MSEALHLKIEDIGRKPQEAWASFRELPLSDTEFRAIAANVAPYLR